MTLQKHLLQSDALYQYVLANSVRENSIQRELREKTIEHTGQPEMMSFPDLAQFLNFIIKLISARKVMEVGVYTGYGTLAMALALPEDGMLIACDISSTFVEMGKPFWKDAGVEKKIVLKIAPALDTMQNLITNGEQNSFDFIFIDADKLNYPQYYQHALQLIRPGGLIALDNVLSFGKNLVLEGSTKSALVMQELNQQLLNDEQISMSMIPIGGGTTLIQKKC